MQFAIRHLLISLLLASISFLPIRATPRASRAADPGPPSIAQGTCQELIRDGGFEGGGAGWEQHGLFEMVDPTWPHSGKLGVWLGALNDVSEWISQDVSLPPGTSSITMQFWWSLMTEEHPGAPFDYLRAQLYQPDGTTIITTTTTINDESSHDWYWNLATADLARTPARRRSCVSGSRPMQRIRRTSSSTMSASLPARTVQRRRRR